MVAGLIHVVRLLTVLASGHRTLVLENVALRQQLAVYRRTRAKPAVRHMATIARGVGANQLSNWPPNSSYS